MDSRRLENLIYTIVWGIIFLMPLTKLFTAGSADVWTDIRNSWLQTLPFLVLFLIHNFCLTPLYLKKNRKVLYLLLTLALLVAFVIFVRQYYPRPNLPDLPPRSGQTVPDGPPRGREPEQFMDGGQRGPAPPEQDSGRPNPPMRPFRPEATALILALLTVGLNLLAKLFFQALEGERRLKELEQEQLESQMQYLRYQISPHFFMNTLNNIHALVDIDPELAKESILHFSKLMRYVLYEGNKATIPLEKETDFLRQYVSLMQLRYQDSVRISLNLPAVLPEMEIPPLLLITFVENAFKHGISYEHPSFVEAGLEPCEGGVHFTCRNSIFGTADKTHDSGIGLENTRKRLELVYGDRFRLDTVKTEDTYLIDLTLPES